MSAERRQWAVGQGIDAARVGDDFRTALPRVDAVDIVTPADSHPTFAEASLAAGRHCFVEKPLAVAVDEGRAVAEPRSATGRVVQVGHIFRFHPVTAALAAALAAGRSARVRYATGRFAGLKRPRTDVGVTQTDAIHYFDLFAYLLGREATRVSAIQRDYLGRGLDDMSVTTVVYGDVPRFVEANYFAPGSQRECVIVGERGALVADFAGSTVVLHVGEHRRRMAAWEAVDEGKEELAATGPSHCGSSSRHSSPPARATVPARCQPKPACAPSRSWRRRRARPASSAPSRSPRSASRVGETSTGGRERIARPISSEISTPTSRLNETRSVEVVSISGGLAPHRAGSPIPRWALISDSADARRSPGQS